MRVMDNLLSNASKYALPGTRVYIDVMQKAAEVVISVKNVSRDRLNVDAEELMERFVRGESSRTTEGSGLGLNIARSLVELQKGTFTLLVDGDLFKAEIRFQKVA
jgi:signal transduction histidine kinase